MTDQDKELIKRDDALECFMGYDRMGDVKDAIAALPAVTVGVKPLVWESCYGDEHQRASAQSILGGYQIIPVSGYVNSEEMEFSLYTNGVHSKGNYNTINVAKVAAQADYEARILAALTPTSAIDPAVIREAALREAYIVVHKWWMGDWNASPQELILALIGEKK